MLGPLLPALIQRWHIQDAQAGTLFTASFVGQFCGAWFATRNLRASILYGSAITAVGCAAMAWVGFGLCTHRPLLRRSWPRSRPHRRQRHRRHRRSRRTRTSHRLLNVAWGLGAIACPVLVRLSSSWRHPALLLCDGRLSRRHLARRHRNSRTPSSRQQLLETTSQPSSRPSSVQPRMPLPPLPLFVFGAAIFLYVGVENALGGWLPSYAVRTNPTLHASSIAIYFWIAELTGRILVTALMTLIGEAALYRICLALLILTQILLCATANISATGIVTLTVLGALSLAPIYPLIMSFLLARTGNHARLGALFATASFGGATLPWLTGVVSTQFQSLRTGLIVPAAGAALLLFLSDILTAKPAPPSKTIRPPGFS